MASLIGHFLSVKRGCLPGSYKSLWILSPELMQLLGPRSGAYPYVVGGGSEVEGHWSAPRRRLSDPRRDR